VWEVLAGYLGSGKPPDKQGAGVTLKSVDGNPGMAEQG
jgi:hypothetical protein